MSIKTYDFKNVSLILGPYEISEFEEGGIEFKKDEDLFTKKKGAGGEISRTKKTGSAGSFIIHLKQTSQSNNGLNALYLLDQSGNGGAVPAILKDNNGTTLISTQNAWIKILPTILYKEEEEMREWTVDCDNCFINIGGQTI